MSFILDRILLCKSLWHCKAYDGGVISNFLLQPAPEGWGKVIISVCLSVPQSHVLVPGPLPGDTQFQVISLFSGHFLGVPQSQPGSAKSQPRRVYPSPSPAREEVPQLGGGATIERMEDWTGVPLTGTGVPPIIWGA